MDNYAAMMDHNQRVQFAQLGGGVVAARAEALRAAGLKDGAHNLLLQDEIKKVQTVVAAVNRETAAFRRRGQFTAEIAAQMTAAEDKAMNEFHAFCDMILALPAHERRVYDGRPYKTQNEKFLEQHAAMAAAEAVRKAAEQVITDAVTHAIDAVTEAGGYLAVVTAVAADMQWGATNVAVAKSVQIIGIPDVSALPADVRQTILTHGQRVATEVLRRQAAALAAPAPMAPVELV